MTQNQKLYNVLANHGDIYLDEWFARRLFNKIVLLNESKPINFTFEYLDKQEESLDQCYHASKNHAPGFNKVNRDHDLSAKFIDHKTIELVAKVFFPGSDSGFILSSDYYKPMYKYVVKVPAHLIKEFLTMNVESIAKEMQEEEDKQAEKARVTNRRKEIFKTLLDT